MQKKLRSMVSWIISILQSFNALLIFPLFLSIPFTVPDNRKDLCTHEYNRSGIKLCAQENVPENKQIFIFRKAEESLKMCDSFAAKHGYSLDKFYLPLVIFLLDLDQINDNTLFFHKFAFKVVGRYSNGYGYVYVTPEMFKAEGITDLEHEIAHYCNDHAKKLMPYDDNEELAIKFEKYMIRYYEQ